MERGRLGLALVALGLALAGTAAAGGPARPVARPDFSGLWSSGSLTEIERPDEFKTLVVSEAEAAAYEKEHRGKPPKLPDLGNPVGGAESDWWERDYGLARIRGQVRTSWLVSPADGHLPLTAAAKAAGKARGLKRRVDFDGPESRSEGERCIAAGADPPFDNGGINDNYQFVQTGDQLAIYAEWMHDVRVVRIGDSRHPPAGLRTRTGDSIGRWEGPTLVIETTNFAASQVAAPDGDPAADMKVVERLTRLSPGEILYAFSVTNPARYSQTFQGEMLLHATKGPIFEYACHEGNYALANILASARRLEGRTVDGVGAGR